MDTAAAEVLAYWFGRPGEAGFGLPRDLWFIKKDATDREIEARFGPLIERGLQGELAGWAANAESALAQIVVLDQFTRNVFRGTPRAFAGDPLALACAQAVVASSQDLRLAPVQSAFVYLPFEHAEDPAMQEESIRLFSRLAAEAPGLDDMLDYARRHRDVIARFGRFPHRNAVLGRVSTDAEAAYLAVPGSGF